MAIKSRFVCVFGWLKLMANALISIFFVACVCFSANIKVKKKHRTSKGIAKHENFHGKVVAGIKWSCEIFLFRSVMIFVVINFIITLVCLNWWEKKRQKRVNECRDSLCDKLSTTAITIIVSNTKQTRKKSIAIEIKRRKKTRPSLNGTGTNGIHGIRFAWNWRTSKKKRRKSEFKSRICTRAVPTSFCIGYSSLWLSFVPRPQKESLLFAELQYFHSVQTMRMLFVMCLHNGLLAAAAEISFTII